MKTKYRTLYGRVSKLLPDDGGTPTHAYIRLYDDRDGEARELTLPLSQLPPHARRLNTNVEVTGRRTNNKEEAVVSCLGDRAKRGLIKQALKRLETAPTYVKRPFNVFTGERYDPADDPWGVIDAVCRLPSGFRAPHVPLWKRVV